MSDPAAAAAAPSSTADDTRSGGGSLWADAWHDLIRNPIFIVSCLVVLVVVSWAAFPTLWTDTQPTGAGCNLKDARQPPGGDHIFGTTVLGCDMYSHIIYGARPSIVIAGVSTAAFRGIRPGHLARNGTRTPPSNDVPLLSRNGPGDPA